MTEYLTAMERRPFYGVVPFLLPVSIVKPWFPSHGFSRVRKPNYGKIISEDWQNNSVDTNQQETNRCTLHCILCVCPSNVQHIPPYFHICLLVSSLFYIGITMEGVNLCICLVNEDWAPLGPNPSVSHWHYLHTLESNLKRLFAYRL